MGGNGCGGNYKGHLIERFYLNTEPAPGGCLLWKGRVNKDGYGTITHHGKELLAHRAAWAIVYAGGVPPVVCHRCDTPRCVRAAHLFAGDPVINVVDRDAKKRTACGERIGNAVLVAADIPKIRSRLSQREPMRRIAKDYGVSPATIGLIRDGKTWRHVP